MQQQKKSKNKLFHEGNQEAQPLCGRPVCLIKLITSKRGGATIYPAAYTACIKFPMKKSGIRDSYEIRDIRINTNKKLYIYFYKNL